MFEGLAGRTRNEAEATVVEFLRERADEILEFTCELIRTPSVNPPGDEVPISKVILEKLRMLGVTERQIVGALDERPQRACACARHRAWANHDAVGPHRYQATRKS